MKKSCGCGGVMTIHMHTLIYSAKIKITHVPVYTCGECSRYEPLPVIKRELGLLIRELGERPSGQQQLSFADRNEWASVLKDIFAAGLFAGGLPELEESIRRSIQGRIDLLLDVYRTAADLSDRKWMEEIGLRLSQLTAHSAESAK
ncbi:hypothetical protein HQN87_00595 [Paenibacillus tritici]|uniref:YgiT-type zinc finger protein n=1 Tax=Paenibacillus tritici TaxID=1873425 RepID=A0ABX2DGR5_9BACL|nr:hypothetical protein [Paenibacillus tritici]NQX43812.1 hypothetical protein [Paenibacillus tritici]QUL57385.1 hypothetical protein KDC22_13460 [Paenibacillus tritici]